MRSGKCKWKQLERGYFGRKASYVLNRACSCYVSYGGADETKRFGVNLSKTRDGCEMRGQM